MDGSTCPHERNLIFWITHNRFKYKFLIRFSFRMNFNWLLLLLLSVFKDKTSNNLLLHMIFLFVLLIWNYSTFCYSYFFQIYNRRPIFLYCKTQNQWLILNPHPNATLFDQCVLLTRVLISSAIDVEVVVIHTVLVGVDLEHDYYWKTWCVCCSSYGSCLFMLISLLLLPMLLLLPLWLLLYYVVE